MNITQDLDKSLQVMLGVSKWLQENGLNPSQWWQPHNMNRDFLLKYTQPEEFFVGLVQGIPVASIVLQETDRHQNWESADQNKPQQALYVQWLCVARQFAGQGLSKKMIEFASQEARQRGLTFLRLDTDAHQKKLCDLYESLGFQLIGTQTKNKQKMALYQKSVS